MRCSRSCAARMARDRTRVTLNGFTALGLVEMTRKRTRESLAHVLCEPCPTCAGRGEVRTAHTVCYDILREILREARAFNAREYRVIAAQPVIDLFLEDEAELAHHAVGLHRQADLGAGGNRLLAGAIRHRADVTSPARGDRGGGPA